MSKKFLNCRPQCTSNSPRMQQIYYQAQKIANSNASIMITGPSGAGKQHLSAFIHRHSPRYNGPFVTFNCAGICPTLIKDELFGHEKGAFTGASQTHIGVFERAARGTLLLDEIGDLPLELQGYFLHALESNEITRVGGHTSVPIDARIICATNVDLVKKIKEKAFRADLYYRLNVISLHLPSLAERQEDLITLAMDFIRKYSGNQPCPPKLSPCAIKAIKKYSWPGNIRELSNVMQRAVLLHENGMIEPEDLMLSDIQTLAAQVDQPNPIGKEKIVMKNALEEAKYDVFTAALNNTNGNISRAAKELGISRYTLYRHMKQMNITP